MQKRETAKDVLKKFDPFGVYEIEEYLVEYPFSIDEQTGLNIIRDIVSELRPKEIVLNENVERSEYDENVRLIAEKTHKLAILTIDVFDYKEEYPELAKLRNISSSKGIDIDDLPDEYILKKYKECDRSDQIEIYEGTEIVEDHIELKAYLHNTRVEHDVSYTEYFYNKRLKAFVMYCKYDAAFGVDSDGIVMILDFQDYFR